VNELPKVGSGIRTSRLVRDNPRASDVTSISEAEITVSTRKNDNVTVRVSQPELAVMSVVIHLRAFEYLYLQSPRSPDRFIELGRLKPKEDAVTIGFRFGVPEMGMFVCVPAMKLQDQSVLINKLLVLRSSMAALTSKERLVPATTGLNVANGNEWLRVHRLRLECAVNDGHGMPNVPADQSAAY